MTRQEMIERAWAAIPSGLNGYSQMIARLLDILTIDQLGALVADLYEGEATNG